MGVLLYDSGATSYASVLHPLCVVGCVWCYVSRLLAGSWPSGGNETDTHLHISYLFLLRSREQMMVQIYSLRSSSSR